MSNFHIVKTSIISIGLLLASTSFLSVHASLIPKENTQKNRLSESSILIAGYGEIEFEKYEPLPFKSCAGMQKYFNSLFTQKTDGTIKFHGFENSNYVKNFQGLSLNAPYYCSGYYTQIDPRGTLICRSYISADPNGKGKQGGTVFPDGSTSEPYNYAYTFSYKSVGEEYESCRWKN